MSFIYFFSHKADELRTLRTLDLFNAVSTRQMEVRVFGKVETSIYNHTLSQVYVSRFDTDY